MPPLTCLIMTSLLPPGSDFREELWRPNYQSPAGRRVTARGPTRPVTVQPVQSAGNSTKIRLAGCVDTREGGGRNCRRISAWLRAGARVLSASTAATRQLEVVRPPALSFEQWVRHSRWLRASVARIHASHSWSSGLFTPRAPRYITCKYVIVVRTSRWPSSSCTVRMS
jgi:hypothetical protein